MNSDPAFESAELPAQQPEKELVDVTEHALEMLENMSEDRHEILMTRTLRRLQAQDVDDVDGEEFSVALMEEVKMMLVNDSMRKLQAAGMVQVVGINDSGELMYEVTPAGQAMANQRLKSDQ